MRVGAGRSVNKAHRVIERTQVHGPRDERTRENMRNGLEIGIKQSVRYYEGLVCFCIEDAKNAFPREQKVEHDN
jgi:malate synthase